MDTADVAKLKVAELRDELSKRGLDTKGLKKDLAERLTAAIEADANGDAGDKDENEDEVIEVDEKDGKEAREGEEVMDGKGETNGDHDDTAMKMDRDEAPKDAVVEPTPVDEAPEDKTATEEKIAPPDDAMAVDADAQATDKADAMDTEEPAAATTSDTLLPPSLAHLASAYPPSKVLYISNLRRPLLLSALHEHLAPTSLPTQAAVLPFSHDDYPGLWLSGVKDHAYAGYDTTSAALATAERVHAQVWPDGGAALDIQFVDPDQVAGLMAKEEAAWGRRQRLVLTSEEKGGRWVFDVVVPTAETRRSGLANPGAAPADRRGSQPGSIQSLADRLGGARAARDAANAGPLARPEEKDKLGPVRRTRALPSLEFREGPGAPERKRRGARGGRGRRRERGGGEFSERGGGDSYQPDAGPRGFERGGGDSYQPDARGPERVERGGERYGGGGWGRGSRGNADRYVPGGRERSPRRELGRGNGPAPRGGDLYVPDARRDDRWRP